MAKIVIPYKPRYPEVHRALEAHRFSVLVAHRRFGKTVLSVNHLLKQALLCQKPRGFFAYIGPFREQTKAIAWKYVKFYSAVIPNRKVNESELSVSLPSDATIRLFGADNPDSLRGLYFDGLILDEVAQMKPEVWGEIIQPALADRQGWAVFIGTPKGINLFYDLYQQACAEMEKKNPLWYAMKIPVTETKALPEAEVRRLKDELSDNTFRQEMLCDFNASTDNVLITLDDYQQAKKSLARVEDMHEWPLIVGVDVARYGDDATVFFLRRGLYAAFTPLVLRHLSNVEVAHELVSFIALHEPEHVFIDQGQGTGVIDLVRSLTQRRPVQVHEIPFGSRASDSAKFFNKRSEMWFRIREWIKTGGRLPDDVTLEAELTAPTYEIDVAGRLKLEPKDKIKERLGRSTDLGDALALTFAVNLPASTTGISAPFDRYGEQPRRKMGDLIFEGESGEKSLFEW